VLTVTSTTSMFVPAASNLQAPDASMRCQPTTRCNSCARRKIAAQHYLRSLSTPCRTICYPESATTNEWPDDEAA